MVLVVLSVCMLYFSLLLVVHVPDWACILYLISTRAHRPSLRCSRIFEVEHASGCASTSTYLSHSIIMAAGRYSAVLLFACAGLVATAPPAVAATPAPLVIGRAVSDFLEAVTRKKRAYDTISDVRSCVLEHVDVESALASEQRGRRPGQDHESFMLEMLLQRYPETVALVECLLKRKMVAKPVLDQSGGKLMFVGISYFGTSPEQFAFIDALIDVTPPFNFSLGGEADGYNVLHKVSQQVAHHSVASTNDKIKVSDAVHICTSRVP